MSGPEATSSGSPGHRDEAEHIDALAGDRLVAAGLQRDDVAQILDGVAAYRHALARMPHGWKRAEINNNLGAALCLLAQKEADPAQAVTALDMARHHLNSALAVRTRNEAPQAWALTQANLAIVHLTLHRHTGDQAEILAGHVAVDGASAVFRQIGDRQWMDWIASIRAHLVEVVDRRKTPR